MQALIRFAAGRESNPQKYKQIPNIPTIIGLALIVVGVIIISTMSDIEVR